MLSCISSLFYIKPQPQHGYFPNIQVVYLLFSTSNHNISYARTSGKSLYIFSFLHQTTTYEQPKEFSMSCISSLFYIKPQLRRRIRWVIWVVYLLFSTSNHNPLCAPIFSRRVVYLLFSTSNHNNSLRHSRRRHVVYLLFSTSNHNPYRHLVVTLKLYIFSFLHQTTTATLLM